MKHIHDLGLVKSFARQRLITTGQKVNSTHWQGQIAPAPMFETMDMAFSAPMPETLELAWEKCQPSTPWAEVHFQERIGGLPLNPPPSHEIWPFGVKNNETFQAGGKFDHTYPERFWPKHAYDNENMPLNKINRGIRFEYGDLNDVINQIINDHHTRQAYLPIFFPEDTGAKGGKGRVPCTIGYHFMVRNGYLHITYWMRSCDYLRHFSDDIYMAVRLAQHVRDEINRIGKVKFKMGLIKFHAVSFHIFDFEKTKI